MRKWIKNILKLLRLKDGKLRELSIDDPDLPRKGLDL